MTWLRSGMFWHTAVTLGLVVPALLASSTPWDVWTELAQILALPLLGGLGGLWVLMGRLRVKKGRSFFSAGITPYPLLVCAFLSGFLLDWPLRARFALSETELQSLVERVKTHQVERDTFIPAGMRVGCFRVYSCSEPEPGVVDFHLPWLYVLSYDPNVSPNQPRILGSRRYGRKLAPNWYLTQI
ncbi:MAG: hypothetical protein AB1486_01560 [Planctomycetota bacterium]